CATDPTLDFGDVLIGQHKTLSTQIGNCGIRALVMTEVATNSSFPPFNLHSTITTPRTLGPNEMIDVEVEFSPTEAARYGGLGATKDPGIILFTTEANGVGSLTLLGRGITPPVCHLAVTPSAMNFGNV